jgi:hypothetical protein
MAQTQNRVYLPNAPSARSSRATRSGPSGFPRTYYRKLPPDCCPVAQPRLAANPKPRLYPSTVEVGTCNGAPRKLCPGRNSARPRSPPGAELVA